MTTRFTQRLRMTRARTVLMVAVVGVGMLLSALPTWSKAQARGSQGLEPIGVAGTEASPAVPSAALVVIIAALVLGLSGRVTRIAAVVAMGLAGILAGASAIGFLQDPAPALAPVAAEATRVQDVVEPVELTGWPVVTLSIAILTIVIALVLPWRMGRWTAVGRRYHHDPSASPAEGRTPRLQALDDWDALSRGEDPSVDPDR